MRDWRRFFPEERPRPLQEEIMDFVVKNWEQCDSFVVEAPTGTGKSAIGVGLARVLASKRNRDFFNEEEFQPNCSYITTTTIELQNQYERCYANKGLLKLYSADHYSCNRRKNLNCADGARIKMTTKLPCPGVCPYRRAKEEFVNGDFGVVNLAYYINETYYAGQLLKRGLMVFDEAHAVGDVVKDFVSLEITEFQLAKYDVKDPPGYNTDRFDMAKLRKWLRHEFTPNVEKEEARIVADRDSWEGAPDDPEYLSVCKECTELDKYLCRVRRVTDTLDPKTWVVDDTKEGMLLTPITPRPFMKEVVTGLNKKNLFMTATILDFDFFVKEHDLDPKHTLFFTASSPFHKDNRKIYFVPCGKLKHNDLQVTMKPFVEAVKIVLDEHLDERGIIFVSSYAQSVELTKQLWSSRLISHFNSSMHEGVDLKDDMSRFQVLLKLPFPSLGSTSIKRRSEMFPEWYAYRTALMLVQASGRSVRNENDRAVTYILDEHFGWFFAKWKRFFPGWWQEALIFAE